MCAKKYKMSDDKFIVFVESLKNHYKNDVITNYKDVIKAIENDSGFILTSSFLNLTIDLITKKNYRVLIELDVSRDDYEHIYNYETLGIYQVFEIKLNSRYGNNTFTESDNLLELYLSNVFYENLNKFEHQEYSYYKFMDNIDVLDRNLTFSIRRNDINNTTLRRESLIYQLQDNGLIEFPYLPSNQMLDRFVPLFLKWYRNSDETVRNIKKKTLMDYIIGYYGEVPEYLEKELLYCSYTEERCIKNFQFLYQLIVNYQNHNFDI